jgi:Caspase domain
LVVALLIVASLLICPPLSYGQAQIRMSIHLGSANELAIDAEYHDPSDIDTRLGRTRIIPMWLTVKNASLKPVLLSYQELRLDLGSASSATPLSPIEGGAARSMLRRDGHYNGLLRFLGSQASDYERDPFSRVLPGGSLGPGKTKSGYVFFLRPDAVSFTGFMALGTASLKPEILATNTYEVRAPETESASLWSVAWLKNQWDRIVYGAPPFHKSYALLLGVSDYKHMKKLSLVNDDLNKMQNFLLSRGFHVVRVQNEKLTVANVRSPQDYFADRITPDDRLLVYFAGHGVHRVERGRERGYLALINAPASGDVSPGDAIAMDDFVAWTRRISAKHLLVLLDACFSGLAVRGFDVQLETRGVSGPKPPGQPDPTTLYRLSMQPGRYLLMAGNENQEAIASSAWTGGLFTHGVLQGLGGLADTQRDGFVTTRELYPWLREFVEAQAATAGRTLTPLIKDLGPDGTSQGEFVFTRGK